MGLGPSAPARHEKDPVVVRQREIIGDILDNPFNPAARSGPGPSRYLAVGFYGECDEDGGTARAEWWRAHEEEEIAKAEKAIKTRCVELDRVSALHERARAQSS
jgi:hypothetical protein